MASYHCTVKVLSRSSGRSSVQFSAYISGEKMEDERLGITFDHTSKEEVCFNKMIFADRVSESMQSQSGFWNSVEQTEKTKDSRVCRTWEIALPHELEIHENIELAKKYAESLVQKDGMPACQVAVHEKEGNWHCHIMAPVRDIDEQGEWMTKEKKVYALDQEGEKIAILDENKVSQWENAHNQEFDISKATKEDIAEVQKTDSRNRKQWKREVVEANGWNDKELVMEWRERASEYQNQELEKKGLDVRVDHRSNVERGMDELPQIHEGYEARKLGSASERVQYNQAVREYNENIVILKQEQSLYAKAKALFEEWKEKISHVREQAKAQLTSRIRGLSARFERGSDRTTDGFHRGDDGQQRDTTTDDIRAEIANRRADIREHITDAEHQVINYASKGPEPEGISNEHTTTDDIRKELATQRIAERIATENAENSLTERETREVKQERLRAEAERKAKERSKSIENGISL